ncbi:low molecular weight phosphotyrosine protein phosphatase [Fructilactobacillus hinvesii]|uniref:protein-tyrosine-phosphatase n=2 Tax=Fructilactobacillus hinvesii TaxID=2940300 RepID=A0ABY5BY15_9LACO|nr:low molecular weight phosphotyrosine protein phosphatase [Fructilactobacillus hinvesii]
MAEVMFQRLANTHGVSNHYRITSAATSDEEAGNPPHPGALQTLQKHQLDASQHRSHPLTASEAAAADCIITMDHSNLAEVQRLLPPAERAKVHLCMDVVPGKAGNSIADPWYTHKFETTYQMLNEALPLWLERLEQKRQEASPHE